MENIIKFFVEFFDEIFHVFEKVLTTSPFNRSETSHHFSILLCFMILAKRLESASFGRNHKVQYKSYFRAVNKDLNPNAGITFTSKLDVQIPIRIHQKLTRFFCFHFAHTTRNVGRMNTDAKKLYKIVKAVIPPNCCKGGIKANTSKPKPEIVVAAAPNNAVPV